MEALLFNRTWYYQLICHQSHRIIKVCIYVGMFPVVCFVDFKYYFWGWFEGRNYFGPRSTKTHWMNLWQTFILQSTILHTEIFQNSEELRLFPHKHLLITHKPSQNNLSKDWKNISLFWENRNNSMEQMFISSSRYGCNQRFYKRKSQVLQLNSSGHFKRRRRLRH